MLDLIGWLATAVFAASYFCKQPASLRRVQALAALMWIGYGVGIGALPVVVANLIVGALALYSAWRPRQTEIVTDAREGALGGSES